ncbi:WDR59 isoform 22, partial [Pan troglodytes]
LYSGSPTRSEKEQVSISSFYYKERKSRRWKSKREGSDSGNRQIKAAGKVIIQDIACLLPVHKSLGELYILNVNDIQETCQKNAASALLVGRKDLVQPSFTSSGSCSSMSDPGLNTGGWNIAGREAEHLSSPWGESSPEELRFGSLTYSDPRERERDQHDKNKRLLDPANTQQFDDFKKCYGEILYRWGLREKRAEVLKFVSCPPDPHKGIEFGVYC